MHFLFECHTPALVESIYLEEPTLLESNVDTQKISSAVSIGVLAERCENQYDDRAQLDAFPSDCTYLEYRNLSEEPENS